MHFTTHHTFMTVTKRNAVWDLCCYLVGTGTSVRPVSRTAGDRRTKAMIGRSRKSTSPTRTLEASAPGGIFLMKFMSTWKTETHSVSHIRKRDSSNTNRTLVNMICVMNESYHEWFYNQFHLQLCLTLLAWISKSFCSCVFFQIRQQPNINYKTTFYMDHWWSHATNSKHERTMSTTTGTSTVHGLANGQWFTGQQTYGGLSAGRWQQTIAVAVLLRHTAVIVQIKNALRSTPLTQTLNTCMFQGWDS